MPRLPSTLLLSSLLAVAVAGPTGVLVGSALNGAKGVCIATAKSVDSPRDSSFSEIEFAPATTAVNVRFDSNTKRFYLPTYTGELYSSEDGIEWDLHWNKTIQGCSSFYDMLFVPDSQVSFILCNQGNTALFSQDGSKTFIPYGFGHSTNSYVSGAFMNSKIGVVLSSLYGGFARSEDGGRSWTETSVPIPLGYNGIGLREAAGSSKDNTLFISGFLSKNSQITAWFKFDALTGEMDYGDLYQNLNSMVIDSSSGLGVGVSQFSGLGSYTLATADGGKTWTNHTLPASTSQLNGAGISPNGIRFVVGFETLYVADSEYFWYQAFQSSACETYGLAFSDSE